MFPIKITDGRTVADAYRRLAPRGLEIRTLMGGVINEQKAFANLSPERCPMAHDMAEHAFFVGIHLTLSPENISQVARILKDFFMDKTV